MATVGRSPRPGPAADDPSQQTATVLLVDDSPVVRRLVQQAIDGQSGYRVVGQAPDGRTALAQVAAMRPDLMVLDLEMAGMDGFATLEALGERCDPTRVIVFANVEAAELPRVRARIDAAGANLVIKPVGASGAAEAVIQIRGLLLDAFDRALGARPPKPPAKLSRVVNAVLIASSTGGPNALEAVLGNLRPLRAPILIVQHISGGFSGRLAEQLDHACDFPVVEAEDGVHPEPGHAYLAPGGIHLTVERATEGRSTVLRLRDSPPVNSCRPSADILFRSGAEIYGPNQLGVVLTGIGQDGLEGCRELGRLGAPIVVQDEATSVVWGMPGAVSNAGFADEILPIDDVGPALAAFAKGGTGR